MGGGQHLQTRWQGRFNLQRFIVRRVAHLQAPSVQPQTMKTHVRSEGPVQGPFAVGRVADDGVGDVLHVAAQLVAATALPRCLLLPRSWLTRWTMVPHVGAHLVLAARAWRQHQLELRLRDAVRRHKAD